MAADFPHSFKLNPNYNPSVTFLPPSHYDLKPILMALEIYVSPEEKFITHPRDIFKKEILVHSTAKESKEWKGAPNMRYWPQQLNFAVWCATTGCGVAFINHLMNSKIPPQIRSFMRFHVYYTIRRILHEMGVALPDSTVFNPLENPYNVQKYNQLCKEFGIQLHSDFRFLDGPNGGLGYTTTAGKGNKYTVFNGRDFFIANDEYAKSGLHKWRRPDNMRARILYMKNTDAIAQWDRFIIRHGQGFSRPGLARLSDSICAYVYCILGAQARVRSSIVGLAGGNGLARKQFLRLLEDLIVDTDTYKNYERYQDAITETKVKLDMAMSPELYMLPSRMIINTESRGGYNNQLKYATDDMHFGYNGDVNNERLGSALHEMDGPPDTRERELPEAPMALAEVPEARPVGLAEAQAQHDTGAMVADPVDENMKIGLIILGVIIAMVKLWI